MTVEVVYRGIQIHFCAAGWTSDQIPIGPNLTIEKALEAVDQQLAENATWNNERTLPDGDRPT